MKRQAKMIMTYPADLLLPLSFSSSKWPMEAKIMKQTNMPMAPAMRDFLRPKFSTTYRPPKVQPKLTAPRMVEVTKELLIPIDLKTVVP